MRDKYYLRVFFVWFWIFLSVNIYANNSNKVPTVVWQKNFDHHNSNYEYEVGDIIKTSDNKLLIVGQREVIGKFIREAWAVKLDAYGNKIWEKTFSGIGYAYANSIIQSGDNGFIIAGYTEPQDSYKDEAWIIKIDAMGNKVWEQKYSIDDDLFINSIIRTKDGGLCAVGYTYLKGSNGYTDAWIIKLDKNGNKIWEKFYGGKHNDKFDSVVQTKDGRFYVVGPTYLDNVDDYGAWIMALDRNGNKIFEKTYRKTVLYSIIQTKDNGLIAVGYKYSKKSHSDGWIIKLNRNGNKIWEKTYGGSQEDQFRKIIQTKDNGLIAVGHTSSGFSGVWVIKLDKNGNKIWETTLDTKGSFGSENESVIQTKDNEFIVAYTDSDHWNSVGLVKLKEIKKVSPNIKSSFFSIHKLIYHIFHHKNGDSIKEILKKINTVSCNQYLTDGSQMFFKICPNGYREIDINYNTENNHFVFAFSPIKKVKFITKDTLINFIKKSNLNDYLKLTQKEMNQFLNPINIDNEIVTKYDNYLHKDIKYIFITFKKVPFNYTFDEIKNLFNVFGAIATNDKNFKLTDAKNKNKRYIPETISPYGWIYDRVEKAYFKKAEDSIYKIYSTNNNTKLIILFPKITDLINSNLKEIVNEFGSKIKKISNEDNYIQIDFIQNLTIKEIEELLYHIDTEVIISGGNGK